MAMYPATSKRPAVEVSKAVVCRHTIGDIARSVVAINPQETPNKAYMKKTK